MYRGKEGKIEGKSSGAIRSDLGTQGTKLSYIALRFLDHLLLETGYAASSSNSLKGVPS